MNLAWVRLSKLFLVTMACSRFQLCHLPWSHGAALFFHSLCMEVVWLEQSLPLTPPCPSPASTAPLGRSSAFVKRLATLAA